MLLIPMFRSDRMSQALSPVGPGEYDTNAQENPFAVWLRNVPTWLDEERFVHCSINSKR